jgi:hypothetical protein
MRDGKRTPVTTASNAASVLDGSDRSVHIRTLTDAELEHVSGGGGPRKKAPENDVGNLPGTATTA